MRRNPERLEAPNPSELRPRQRLDVARQLGRTAVRGSEQKRR